jgi:proteasome lid subunit RPN8/RPN11
VVIPAEVRTELAEHARSEEPNEACGLVVVKDGIAIRYEPGTNEDASPYRFNLVPRNPETLFLVDEGYEVAIFHSHISSPPRPSRTDVERIGHWEGYPYLIYTVRTDELAGWRIANGSIEPLPLTLCASPESPSGDSGRAKEQRT